MPHLTINYTQDIDTVYRFVTDPEVIKKRSEAMGEMNIKIQVDEAAEKDFHYAGVERVFAPLCVFTACSMAFAHGSNDVANAVGPLAAVASTVQSGGMITAKSAMPWWILIVGALGIVVGLVSARVGQPFCAVEHFALVVSGRIRVRRRPA